MTDNPAASYSGACKLPYAQTILGLVIRAKAGLAPHCPTYLRWLCEYISELSHLIRNVGPRESRRRVRWQREYRTASRAVLRGRWIAEVEAPEDRLTGGWRASHDVLRPPDALWILVSGALSGTARPLGACVPARVSLLKEVRRSGSDQQSSIVSVTYGRFGDPAILKKGANSNRG